MIKRILINLLYLLLATAFLFVSVSAWATTSTVGSGKDYSTIQACINARTSSDDVCDVYGGTYYSGVTQTVASGTSGHPITISCHAGQTCQMDRIAIYHNYITFSGFHLYAPGYGNSGWDAEIWITGSYNTISGNTLHGGGLYTTAGSYGLTITGGMYNTISGNTWDGGVNYVGINTGANGAALIDSTKSWTTNELQGMFIRNNFTGGYSESITSNTSNTITASVGGWTTGDYYTAGQTFYIPVSIAGKNNTFSGNTFKRMADVERVFNIGGECDYTTISGNEVYSLKSCNSPAPYDLIHSDIFQRVIPTSGDLNCRYGRVYNNYFHDLDSAIGQFDTHVPAELDDWIFYNNVFANITARAGIVYVSWYNNTFFQVNTANNNVIDHYAPGIARNNIIIGWGTSGTGNLFGPTATYDGTHDHNYFSLPKDSSYGARTAATIDSEGETNYVNGGDPHFEAAYNDCVANICNFHLTANSTILIGKGAQQNAIFTTDLAGTTRGSVWDIGAYEYEAGGGDVTAPSVSTAGGSFGRQ